MTDGFEFPGQGRIACEVSWLKMCNGPRPRLTGWASSLDGRSRGNERVRPTPLKTHLRCKTCRLAVGVVDGCGNSFAQQPAWLGVAAARGHIDDDLHVRPK